ncbi:hypothetical protein DL98DRAFT_96255 [Cadophora sp. DSE1049]|nr:hypothetical protein DL98DRAFT_96255 [Cadophora sp. DSE1049]
MVSFVVGEETCCLLIFVPVCLRMPRGWASFTVTAPLMPRRSRMKEMKTEGRILTAESDAETQLLRDHDRTPTTAWRYLYSSPPWRPRRTRSSHQQSSRHLRPIRHLLNSDPGFVKFAFLKGYPWIVF